MSECWRNITTVLLLLLMCFMPVACKELMGAETSISRMFSSILYIIPLSCLIASLHKRWLFITLSAIIMITSFVEMVMVLLYSNYLTAGNLLAILTTNVDEGGGFHTRNSTQNPLYPSFSAGMDICYNGLSSRIQSQKKPDGG